ncbi:PAS domain-containing hybrid sensor histidine kinase/response regulator [Thalassobius vesicularis]|uniref:histidine kinase n=1 Tax=Thalassobius vesicularis TaxID=1294297 RepID=A0A4S3M9V7_9RHOB|nr:PAS domain-containing hybrid sensor histidine kinase/response regulator [Thalassobius vesicularis]THD74757.1 PAS domain-containing hybrid sensor histidine kinase/response regulator [Thalassobius vesicularis]
MRKGWTLRRQGYTVLLTAALLCIMAIVSLTQAVSRDLDLLESANSDNVQWTLSQAEVEYLSFERSLDHALAARSVSRDQIQRGFDIFYSRITTLETGSLYKDLRNTAEFNQALANIRVFLDGNVDLIDRLDSATEAEMLQLETDAEALSNDVRHLSTSGLYYFAKLSDNQRESISVSLMRLAFVTTSLIAALGLLAYYSHWMGQQTERSKRELEAAYTRLNTVVNASLDAVIVSDYQGRVLDFNKAAEKIFGYSLDQVLGLPLADFLIPPDLRNRHREGIARMNLTGETRVVGHGRIELRAMRANEEVFPCELALESAGSGKDRIVIGFLRDITSVKAAEQELVEARDHALAGEKAKADFLAVMTHEIRTPLNGVLGNLSLLEGTKLNDRQTRFAQNMQISARQLMAHVDAVLDIARYEAGKHSVRRAPTDLGAMLQDIVASQSGYAAANRNTLSSRWEGEPPGWVMADAAQVQQVLLNLVGNAIKFTHGGQITLEAECLDAPAPQTARIEFRVIDTGIGIAEADQARIFNDFQTVDASYQRSAGGTGLGLGIVQRLVHGMGGELGVESEPGEGSVFWVRLDFAQTAEPETRVAYDSVRSGSRSLQVLAVEDNEINLQILQEHLALLGHTVSVAHNGQEGVDAAAATRFDAIFMDISMPVMDGLEAARRIRAGGGASHDVPIIALSANVLPEMRERITQAGMTGFVGKPYQQQDLLNVLDPLSEDAPANPASNSPQPGVLSELQDRFERETDELLDWLETLPEDHAEIAARSHMVAGSAAAFGNLDLRNGLIRLEQAAEQRAERAVLERHIAEVRQIWSDA